MATEKWSATLSAYSDIFTASTLNSIVNGNAILSDLVFDNTSALDVFFMLSFIGGSITTAAPNFIGIYKFPILDDATNYGSGQFGTSAAGPPPATYWVGNIMFPVGTQALKGGLGGGPVHLSAAPGKSKFVLYNQAGATLAGSGANTLKIATYNRSIA